MSENEINQRLAIRFPEMLAMNRSRAAQFGARWGTRVRTDQAINPEARPERSWMLRRVNQETAYEYWVDITFTDDGGGQPTTRTVRVQSDRNLTYEQIYARAGDVFNDIAERYKKFQGLVIHDDTMFLVVYATRRS